MSAASNKDPRNFKRFSVKKTKPEKKIPGVKPKREPMYTTNTTGVQHNYGKMKKSNDPSSNNTPERMAKRFFIEMLKRDQELRESEPGVYTWILRHGEDGNHFYANKVISQQEMGTLHMIIDDLSTEKYGDSGMIMVAGELQVYADPPRIDFNFQSGTFSSDKDPDYLKTMESIVPPIIQESFGIDNVNFINDEPLIGADKIISSLEHIAFFNRFLDKTEIKSKNNNPSRKGGKRKTRRTRKSRK